MTWVFDQAQAADVDWRENGGSWEAKIQRRFSFVFVRDSKDDLSSSRVANTLGLWLWMIMLERRRSFSRMHCWQLGRNCCPLHCVRNIRPWKIFPLDKYWPWKYSPLKNIHIWKIFTPEKYSLLKNIHPWKIFTPENIQI